MPVVVLLVICIAGSLYMYTDAVGKVQEVEATALNLSGVVSGLQVELDKVTTQVDELVEENNELANEKTGLEGQLEEIEAEIAELVEPKPDIVIDVLDDGEVRNVILFIGDGMGVGQLTAAEVMNGEDDLTITNLPYMTFVTTYSSSNYVTDSAASATALATGFKTRNAMIGLSPDGDELYNVIEDAESVGKATGVVSTARVTHATPASFFAHVNSRDKEAVIAEQLLLSTVDVALGGGVEYFTGLTPEDYGFTVVTTQVELEESTGRILGLFSDGYMSYDDVREINGEPSLTDMTAKSIDLLSSDPEGFFLMVEGGRIDHASHANDFDNTVSETLAFDEAVLYALDFASSRNDTLILVTADHETGGLSITGGYPSSGLIYEWVSDDHIGSMVPLYGYGPKASQIIAFNDNTDIGEFLLKVIE